MNVTITLGWWLIPAVATLAAFAAAFAFDQGNEAGAYGAGAFISLLFYLVAALVSLVAWNIYAFAV